MCAIRYERTGNASHTRRRPLFLFFAVAFLIAVIAGVNLINLDPSLGWGGDTAMYIMNARNLVEGNPYNATRYIQNPYSFLGPPAYPPGYPLLLAPVYAVYGLNIHAFNVFTLCLFIVTLAAVGYYFRDQFPVAHGSVYLLALIALIGLNPALTQFASKPLSDIPFLLFVFLSLIALQRAYARIELSRFEFMPYLLAGACVYLAISTRIVGVAFLPAIFVYDLSRYRRLTRVSLLGIPLCLLLLGTQSALLSLTNVTVTGAGSGYGEMMEDNLLSRLSGLPEESAQHAIFYAKSLHAFWLSDEDNLWITPFVIVTLLLAAGGFIYRVTTRYTIIEPFSFLYFVALLPWSATWWRYLIPVIPFYFFYMLIGLSQLQRLLNTRYPVLLIAILLIASVPYSTRYMKTIRDHAHINPDAPNSTAAFTLYRYIRTHTDPDDVIIFMKPRILTLYTGRYASTFTYAYDPKLKTDQAHLHYFRSIKAGYAIDGAGPPDRDHTIRHLAERHPQDFELVYTSGPFRLYRFDADVDR